MAVNATTDGPPSDDETTSADETDPSAESDVAPAVSVRDLTKVYGDGEEAVRAVDDVSFDVQPGTVVGVLGPNGAGKTTTIKSMLGLVEPTAGEVTIAGHSMADDPRGAYREVGAMLEGARNVYWRLTVRENLEFFAALGGASPGALRERHDELLAALDLTEKADVAVRELSRGMKQKVSLATTLAKDASVVFLDEPTLGLDVESSLELRRELRRLADQENVTAVVTSHDMDVIEDVCDRVVIMNEGSVIADDTVSNLIDLFRAHAYRVTVDGTIAPDVRRTIEDGYDTTDWDHAGDRESFTVTLPSGTAFYDFVDDLRASGLPVEAVESVEPDLEDVFLELTNGDGKSQVTDAASGGDGR